MGHSDCDKPRLYHYDLAEEQDHTPWVRSVVVIPSDPDQPKGGPEVEASQEQELSSPGDIIAGQDIRLPGDSEESPRSREGRVVAATLEQEMG